MANTHKMNPFKAHFYTAYLELYEFGTPLELRIYDIKLYDLELPDKIRKLAYQAKHEAKYCTDRVKELKRMYSRIYTDGYVVRGSDISKMLYWEQFDPRKDEVGMASVCLFAKASDHKTETIIYERSK